jgi:predicted ATP-dependent serine protease
MSASTEQRTTWTCENCRRESHAGRKRCADCGTSRY